MATLGEQLSDEQKSALVLASEKSVEEAVDQSIQARASQVASGAPLIWWFNRPCEYEISPWWSPSRDLDLREFVKKEGNDILVGAVSSMVKKIKSTGWLLDGPAATVSRMQQVLAEAEFGQGWTTLISKTVEDYLTCDRGAFWELIGEGSPDEPMDGLPTGIAHLDSCSCQLTGDVSFPVIYHNTKDGKPHKLHATRVAHMVDMPSPNEAMNNVGFCSVSRVIASSQLLLMLSQYKRERLDDLPQAGLLILNNILPQRWEDAQKEYERERRKLGQEIWANIMTLIGVDPAQPASADFINFSQIPEHFDEQATIDTYINIVALAMGVDAREFWPQNGPLGSATESLVMHTKAKGKGLGDLLATIERVVNWKVLPRRVTFSFDYSDDAEDLQAAELNDLKVSSIMKMFAFDPLGQGIVTIPEMRQMLADNTQYFSDDFLIVDLDTESTVTDTEREDLKMNHQGRVAVPRQSLDQLEGVLRTAVENYKRGDTDIDSLLAFAVSELADGR